MSRFTNGGITISDLYNMTFSEFYFWYKNSCFVADDMKREQEKITRKRK